MLTMLIVLYIMETDLHKTMEEEYTILMPIVL